MFLLQLCVAMAAEPAPLPKRCVADSPTDQVCTSIKGSYRIELSPATDETACVVTTPVSGILTVTSEGKVPTFEAKALSASLGLQEAPGLGADIRDGVCCLDLRMQGSLGDRGQRVWVSLAAGATVVSAKVKERWWFLADGDPKCDGPVAATVTRIP